ncbi:MAG: Uma2 family endonuclease [Symploca sp. SIO2E9]|nr:Uma2 family endonuclease [Symploca sp. SIO2E9]
MNSPTHLPPQSDPPLSPRQTLPTMYDLLSEDPEEPGLPDEFHPLQSQLLWTTFRPRNWNQDQVFSSMDLNLYYDLRHPQWYKRPDWFGVVGVSRLYDGRDLRLSYVIWQEQVSPLVIVELLSPGTEEEDLGQTVSEPGKPPTKWQVYEQILRVPYYVVFSRYTDQMQGFCLVGERYQKAQLTKGRLLIPSIELSLGLWRGSYENIERLWLRWMTASGDLIPLASEELSAAEQRAKAAEQRANAAEQEVRLLRARLRELGIDSEQLNDQTDQDDTE